MSNKTNIRIVKFWTKYAKPGDPRAAYDMVEYCAPGQAQRLTAVARVADLAKVRENAESDDISAQMALGRWHAIKPAYEAWKNNQKIPTNGIPLAAWPGLSPEQAEILLQFGLRTVEEIADASSSVITRVQLPGVLDIQANAKRFLAAQDQTKVADELAKKDGEITELRDQLEELRQLVLTQAAAEDDEDKPKRRGRPAREETAAA